MKTILGSSEWRVENRAHRTVGVRIAFVIRGYLTKISLVSNNSAVKKIGKQVFSVSMEKLRYKQAITYKQLKSRMNRIS